MKLTKSFEQGVCIMAIIATQTNNAPVSSRALQHRLKSSITYSQKILRKLVVADLIQSVPGASGGFTLAKPINCISVLDVVEALEGAVDSFPNTGLFSSIFSDQVDSQNQATICSADEAIHRVLATADAVWRSVLEKVNLEDIIKCVITSSATAPSVDWNDDKVNISNIFNTISSRGDQNHD